jgi:hypothetical protein
MGQKNPKKIHKTVLTTQEFKELTKAAIDVFFFAQFIYLIHPIRGKVPFDLFPFQKSVLWEFLTHRMNIVLKFRQAGITELISMYCLWLAMYHPNKNIVMVSIKERVAKKILRKIKYMYKNLPDHLKVEIANGRGEDLGTSTELEFVNGSMITSIPTTEEAGRGEAVSLLVIDEAAIVRWANQIWAAAFPTLSTGGAAIVNSTPYGVGNWFHQMWVGAFSGGNGFNPIRLRWQMHPERDMAWYNQMAQILGSRRTAQEIDGDFLTSGNSVFNLSDIRAIEDEISEFVYASVERNGSLYINHRPVKGEQYFIAADISTGRSRDYSTFTILDRYGMEYASYKQKISVGHFADLLMKIGKEYNMATIAPESNDVGLAVTEKIQEAGYSKLYYSKKFLRERNKSKPKEEAIPGWITTSKNRPVIIAQLEEDIRLNNITTYDPFFVQEAYTFIYNEENRPVAMGKGRKSNSDDDNLGNEGFSDDAILGKAITNYIRKGKVGGPIIMPR